MSTSKLASCSVSLAETYFSLFVAHGNPVRGRTFNHLLALDTGVSLNEVWSQTRSSNDNLRQAHVWGCPVYVLEAELQYDKKTPQWDPRAHLGMFVGFSPVHSSLVLLVLNVWTGKISPQYHIVFNDKFSTVNSLPSNKSLDAQ